MNHGDMWLNNMMFKSDKENNPIDVKMIDFQVPFWSGPAPDILYFLVSSIADDIKVEHFDEFIEFYHEQLTSSLKQLKFDQHIPTLPEMYTDLLDKGAYGMLQKIKLCRHKIIILLYSFLACMCLMFILFIVKNDSPEEINIERMMKGSTEVLHRIYNGAAYKKSVKLWMNFLNKRGFLDILIVDDEK